MLRNKYWTTLTLAVVLSILAHGLNATPLDDYVNTPDSHYKYEVLKVYDSVGAKVYVLNMTSQKWLDETIVKNPIWWHIMTIAIPDKITRPNSAFMLINGGGNGGGYPDQNKLDVTGPALFAETTGAVGAVLSQIPNQPTTFIADPSGRARTEDAIIAWTWKTFLENPDNATILLRLPMTKAAVRAMDTIVELVEKMASISIKTFMIAGASKRGWTTWTTAAVDKRVFAALPIVMDMLNLNQNLHNHFRSLGGWTFAFESYYELNVTQYMDTQQMFEMQRVVDPAFYFDRYRDVKFLVVNTAGDEFFIGDDTYYFWNDLVSATDGSCLLRRLPNAEHSLAGHTLSLFFTFRSFFLTLYDKQPVPIVKWSRPNNATHAILEAYVDTANGLSPFDATLYYANTLDNKRRDFRLFIKNPNDPSKPLPHPVIWKSSKSAVTRTESPGKLTYRVALPKPISGWLGSFIQLSFKSVDNSVIQVTTETNIVPETYPFPDCTREGCIGTLV